MPPLSEQQRRQIEQLPVRYRIEQLSLIGNLVPSLLRKPKMMAWLRSLLTPLLSLQLQFAEHVALSRRELSYNGQTLSLQRALNDRFDPAFRRIRIINSDTEAEPSYDNFISEAQPWQFMGFISEAPPYAYDFTYAEILNQVGFTVRVPRSLFGSELALQARIKQLKLALIKHKLIYFS